MLGYVIRRAAFVPFLCLGISSLPHTEALCASMRWGGNALLLCLLGAGFGTLGALRQARWIFFLYQPVCLYPNHLKPGLWIRKRSEAAKHNKCNEVGRLACRGCPTASTPQASAGLGIALGFLITPLVLVYLLDRTHFFSTCLLALCPTLYLGLRCYRTALTLLTSDAVTTVRAYGLPPTTLLHSYLFPPLLRTLLSSLPAIALQILLAGLGTETLYQLPGIGAALLSAIFQENHSLVLSLTLLHSFLLIAFTLLVDLLYTTLMPHARKA